MNAIAPAAPNKAIVASWVCLAIAWLCFIVPLPGLGLFIGWPLNLVAFILAIVAMSKGGAMSGLFQLLASLIVSPIVYFVGFAIMVGVADGVKQTPDARTGMDTPAVEQPAEQVAPSQPIITVSASQLFKAYEANEVSADNAYKGRTLVVTGKVGGIKKDFTDTVYVTLEVDIFKSVHVLGIPETIATGLSKGQPITVQCEGNGMIMLSPLLKDCAIQ